MNEPSPYATPESDVAPAIDAVLPRKALVPTWIKVFGWIFVVMGGLMPIMVIFSIATDTPISLALFGLRYNGPGLNGWALFLAGLYMFLAITAFGLLFEKDWGLDACIANGIIGACVCIYAMILTGPSNIRLELLIQLFYLRRLFIIRPQWRTSPSSQEVH